MLVFLGSVDVARAAVCEAHVDIHLHVDTGKQYLPTESCNCVDDSFEVACI